MQSLTPTQDDFFFLPIGGTGEIGMNLTAYGHDYAWLAIDLGITFGGDDFPDHPVMMADPVFLAARRDMLAGLVLTHAHEDHIGALPYVWQRLKCPIYATPFTAALARAKLARAGLAHAPVYEIGLGERFHVGPFTVEYIGMTHSIPEPNALLISTPVGAVFHTGDWKLDDKPVIGEIYDQRRLLSLRSEPLLAMVCDSTNAVVPGSTSSESDLYKPLLTLAQKAEGRIIVTSFASNVARLVTLARVAQKVRRRFGVIGQAMERMLGVARATGYWPKDVDDLLDSAHLGHLPRHEVFAVCTGSQGEPRSALDRLARDAHRDLLMDPGDLVIFSSKLIPGNERSVERIQRRLAHLDIDVVTDHDALVHVSGHPAQDDLRRLYQWVQPPLVIPVHGTPRHLQANADIAQACHVPQTCIVEDGDLCRLSPTGVQVLTQVETGRLTATPDGRLEKVPESVMTRMRAKVH